MPWSDWQFWVVTAVAGCGLGLVLRPFLPRRRPGRRTSLTIDGKNAAPRRSSHD